MKKTVTALLLLFVTISHLHSQTVNGEIISEENNVTIIALWGTSEERGYAYGYLLGDKMVETLEGFQIPFWGDDWPAVKEFIAEGVFFNIDSIYWNEAQAIVDGVTAAGFNNAGYTALDVMASNCWHDISDWLFAKENAGFRCSALMNWKEATEGTDLGGCSVISRHLDGPPVPALTENAVIVIHIPTEKGKQPWLLIGYAGDMAPYSGISSSGLSIFSTVLDDQTWNNNSEAGYEPFRFTYRKALESIDYNGDGENNMLDIRDAISSNSLGYSNAWNFAALAPSTAVTDSLIALVAEVAPEAPYITFRTNSYKDTIPGDNLFAANSQIKRNDSRNYCWRYYGIVNHIGDGTGIGSQDNWGLMKNYTNVGDLNMQFMQYIPEWGQLNLSVYHNNIPAYLHDPVSYDVNSFFDLRDPIAVFIANTASIVEGDSVFFMDLSTNDPESWAWEFEGCIPETSNEQNPIVIYHNSGYYDVTLTVTNAFGSDVTSIPDYIYVEGGVGITPMNSGNFQIYPNPANDQLCISSTKKIQSLDFYNNTGQIVKSLNCNTEKITIDISSLSEGIYFIRVQASEVFEILKVVVMR